MKELAIIERDGLPPLKIKRPKIHRNAVLWIVFAVFIVYSITLVFPFLWMLLNSFRANDEFFKNVWGLPKSITFANYYEAIFKFQKVTKFGKFNILSMFGISAAITACGTLLNVFVSSLGAYTVAKYKFFGRNALYSLSIFLMIVPVVGTLPSQFKLMMSLGLVDNVIGLLLLYSGGFGFNFFMLYGFFKNISWSYSEAAFVDGAGDATVFFKIMIPLAAPALIAISVIHAIGLWNDFTTPSIFLKSIPTLAVGLKYANAELIAGAKYTVLFSAMIVALLPILAVFIIFQKTIMQNTIAGGLKG